MSMVRKLPNLFFNLHQTAPTGNGAKRLQTAPTGPVKIGITDLNT